MSIDIVLKENTILRGRYLVGKVLGQGGFGITYEGMDLVLETKIAIKEYYPMGIAVRNSTISNDILWSQTQISTQQWQEGCDSFLKEARRMAKLDSLPGIVHVRDTFPENNTAYIVMDFVEGQNLKDYLRANGIMTFSKCLELFTPLMQSLDQIHKKELIHRDISPDNIMLKPDGTLCLLDFGAAKDISLQRNAASKQVAKKGFSPPEQYMESGIIGPWTDVYALCATMYYCITGKMIPEAMERVLNDTLSFDIPMLEVLSTSVMEQFKHGLALRPAERIASMGELLLGLTKKQDVPTNIGKAKKSETYEEKRGEKSKLKRAFIVAIPAFVALIIFIALLPGWKWDYTVSNMGVIIHDYKGNKEEIEIPKRIWGKDVINVEPWSIGFGSNVDHLESILVAENHPYLSSEEGVLYNKDMSELLVYPKDKTRMWEYTILAEKIGDFAFQNSCIDAVVITENVKVIGKSAFLGCLYLKEVTIPSSVTEIGTFAFSDSGLEKITFSEGITELSWGTFWNTNIEEVVLPESLEVINEDVFHSCEKLEYVWIPKTVRQIGEDAFANCPSLEYIEISPDCQVDENAFDEDSSIDIYYYEISSGLNSNELDDFLDFLEQYGD